MKAWLLCIWLFAVCSPAWAQNFVWGAKTGIAINRLLPNKLSSRGEYITYRASAAPLFGLYGYYKPTKSNFDLMFGPTITRTGIRIRHYINPSQEAYFERRYASFQFDVNSGIRFEQLPVVIFRPYIGVKMAFDMYTSTGSGVNTFTGNAPNNYYYDDKDGKELLIYPYITLGIDMTLKMKKKLRLAIMLEYNYAPSKFYLRPIDYTILLNQAELPISGSNSYVGVMVRWFWVKASAPAN